MNIKLAIKLIAIVMGTSIAIGSLLQSVMLAEGVGKNGVQGNGQELRYRAYNN